MGKGGEAATWQGRGVGRPTGRGLGASWRGSLVYQTASPKWARLNSVVIVVEYEIDENGNATVKEWEWK